MNATGSVFNQAQYDWNQYKAHRCDVLARLARRQKKYVLQALWEVYAKQYRDRGDSF